MAFTQKLLTVQITPQNGQPVTLSGLRMSATIRAPGGETPTNLELAVYGMSLSEMNQLTVIPGISTITSVPITVQAGDEESGLSTVFTGNIYDAYVDAQNMPNVSFRLTAQVGGVQATQPAEPISVQGSADVATFAQNWANRVGFALENNDVKANLADTYQWGSPLTQITAALQHAGVEYVVDPTSPKPTLAIWMPGQSRKTDDIPIISPSTGMIGYPAFRSASIFVKTLFNNRLKYGQQIMVQSSLTPANRTWHVINIEHYLESKVFNGKWFTEIQANTTGPVPA